MRRRVAFISLALTITTAVMVYPPLRLFHLALGETLPLALTGILLIAVPFGMRFVHERINAPWTRAATAVVMTWLGVCFVAFSLLLPFELFLAAGFLDPTTTGWGLIGVVALASGYGIHNARRLTLKAVDLNVPVELAHVRGKRMVQISDVHIGSRQPGFLNPIVDQVNAAEPDYVVITGDLIDMRDISRDALAPLRHLRAPALFCIGNHERYVDLERICDRLESLGVEVLRNTTSEQQSFQFIGIDDAERKDQVARSLRTMQPAPNAYRILLYHRPDGAEDAADWGAHLMLTGHTHRGQIVPFNYLVKKVFPKYYQMYNVDDLNLYVSPGTGTWGPVMRLGSKCEITLFRLL